MSRRRVDFSFIYSEPSGVSAVQGDGMEDRALVGVTMERKQ
jgi:hypothetical protein